MSGPGAPRQLAASVQVVQTGNAAQLAEAQTILTNTRRALYHLLAEGAPGDGCARLGPPPPNLPVDPADTERREHGPTPTLDGLRAWVRPNCPNI